MNITLHLRKEEAVALAAIIQALRDDPPEGTNEQQFLELMEPVKKLLKELSTLGSLRPISIPETTLFDISLFLDTDKGVEFLSLCPQLAISIATAV